MQNLQQELDKISKSQKPIIDKNASPHIPLYFHTNDSGYMEVIPVIEKRIGNSTGVKIWLAIGSANYEALAPLYDKIDYFIFIDINQKVLETHKIRPKLFLESSSIADFNHYEINHKIKIYANNAH